MLNIGEILIKKNGDRFLWPCPLSRADGDQLPHARKRNLEAMFKIRQDLGIVLRAGITVKTKEVTHQREKRFQRIEYHLPQSLWIIGSFKVESL